MSQIEEIGKETQNFQKLPLNERIDKFLIDEHFATTRNINDVKNKMVIEFLKIDKPWFVFAYFADLLDPDSDEYKELYKSYRYYMFYTYGIPI